MRGASGARSLVAPLLLALLGGCQTLLHREPEEPPPEPAASREAGDEDPLPVKKVQEEIVVAAWAVPAHLPPGGGQAQILVRVQKRGGAPFPGVEVRLKASAGSLYSAGKILVTDGRGMTRDRLTAQRTAQITLNAGGTRYRFKVPLEDAAPKPER